MFVKLLPNVLKLVSLLAEPPGSVLVKPIPWLAETLKLSARNTSASNSPAMVMLVELSVANGWGGGGVASLVV